VGDATNESDVRRLMGGRQANLLLTDPPYGVGYVGKTKDALTIQNDRMEDGAFRAFLASAFASADAVMRPGAAFYVWHADSQGFAFRAACREVGWTVRQCLVWVKNAMVMGRADYQWAHEVALYGWKEGAAHQWLGDRCQTTVLEFDRPSRSKEHPTMKPVALFAYQMSNSSRRGQVVLDLFAGSGTTLIAAEQTGRTAHVLELDPRCADVIVQRWERFTGKQAERMESDETTPTEEAGVSEGEQEGGT
jgi:site-specific DNA-methyltransferase (adenine-specific)